MPKTGPEKFLRLRRPFGVPFCPSDPAHKILSACGALLRCLFALQNGPKKIHIAPPCFALIPNASYTQKPGEMPVIRLQGQRGPLQDITNFVTSLLLLFARRAGGRCPSICCRMLIGASPPPPPRAVSHLVAACGVAFAALLPFKERYRRTSFDRSGESIN